MASRRLLLVEDSSTMRRMLSTMLKEEGYEVETANDGLKGWRRHSPWSHMARTHPDRL